MVKELIQQIKEGVPLHDYMAQSGVEFVARSGDSWRARCWQHEDKTPSLVVSVRKSLFNCFSTGCEARGDVISFYEQFNACDRSTAIRELAATLGLEAGGERRDPQSEELKTIMRKVTEECALKLFDTQRAVDYVKSRGVTDETAIEFQIGYSPSASWIAPLLKDHSPSLLRSMELDSYKYQNVLIFPCVDPITGMIAHFVRPFVQRSSKYLGPTATNPTRWKGMTFGLQVARKHYREKGSLLLVEGQFDCLTLHSHGFPNAVCMLGSNPTPEQFASMESLSIKKAVFLFDGDKAGVQGSDACFTVQTPIRRSVAFLPDGDPDEFVLQYGPDALQEVLDKAQPPVEYIISRFAGGLDGDSQSVNSALKQTLMAFSRLSHEEFLSGLVILSRSTGLPTDALLDLITEDRPDTRGIIDSERQLLAMCMQDLSQLAVAASLPEDVWLLARHRDIYRSLFKLESRGVKEVTVSLVREALGDTGDQKDIEKLFTLEPSNLDFHVGRIREAYIRRQTIVAAKKLSRDATNQAKEISDVIGVHLQEMSNAASPTVRNEWTAEAVVTKAMEFIHERMENPGVLPGIGLGDKWQQITKILLGLQKNRLYLLGAGPKVGKTSLGLNWAVTCAVEKKKPLLWVNLEMAESDLAMRCLAMLSGVSSLRVQAGTLSSKEKELLDTKAAEFYTSPFHIFNAFGMTVEEVLAGIRKYVYKHSVEVAFLDYVQLLNVSGGATKGDYWERHSYVSTQLKQAINNGLGIPLVALSQLGRAAGQEGSSSGGFIGGSYKYVQDCDVFMGLRVRTDKELEDGRGGNLLLTVEYNRHGPQDVFTRVHFNRDNLRMEEIE